MAQITAHLSREAKAGWDSLAAEHGTTLTGMIEAIGRILHTGGPSTRLTVTTIVRLARQVDIERRSRQR